MKIQSGLANGQVLQRLGRQGASAHLTGTTKETGPVRATLTAQDQKLPGWKRHVVGQASAGQFEVWLSGLPPGGPFLLTLECGTDKTTTSFLVGDVWLLAGQSNMQGLGNLTGKARPHPLIRAFTLRREWKMAQDPLHVLGESPDICHHGGRQLTPGAARLVRQGPKGTGLGIFFAQTRMAQTKVPQALICTAHGGTSMAQWNPTRKKEGPASLYASMLASVAATGQPLAGVLWYQGESDCAEPQAADYSKNMQALVRATRRDLRLPRLPWAVVQLGRKFGDSGNAYWWNFIQEQQRLLPSRIRHLETVAAIDLPMDDRIHIGSDGLAALGERLALTMAYLLEGKGQRPPQLGPIRVIQSDLPNERWLEISFSQAKGPLRAEGPPSGFALLDAEDHEIPLIYRTSLHGTTVRLHYPPLEKIRVSYGHGCTPICNIVDARGFSLPVFGPLSLKPTRAILPFVTQWASTSILPTRKPLGSLQSKDLARETHDVVTTAPAPDGFIDQHHRWEGHTGQTFFFTELDLPEPMTLRFLMGYDGPFALWVDKKRLFLDESGTNPAVADQSQCDLRLKAGRHKLRVAMDLVGGAAWGFFLRFERLGLSKKQIAEEAYSGPTYLGF